ncbi:hypothetical protein [Streptomyces corynorhini]|uniref:Uncharacterized protein n=1 Tax=Streptomyces corynorhini TaxID=2282652 RepID=A0A370BBF4_9ACTN|nr:hypothetical protein [Streptomyces corynorhini]RDG37699.1 hypothetical protein DVH02_13100 [Streptomyces corynorhini]
MNMEQLVHGNFATLDTTIADWSTVINSLRNLEKDAREDMKRKSDKARWEGVNATVSREFIDKTAGEFADALTQATTIHDILKDTRDELVGFRDELKETIERARKKNLTVTSTAGGGFTVTMLIHPDRAAKGTEVAQHSQQDVDYLRDDVQRILNRATESDTSADKVLRAIVDQADKGFSGASYSDRESAAEALEKAEEVAQIIKKKGDDMSPAEFDKVNATLAAFANDPLFQEKFASTLGARGVLDFWADISDPSDGGSLQHTRFNQFGDLQKNLSLTLAGATHSDSPRMQDWKEDMLKLSGETIQTRGTQVKGFQLMSNLMRVGDYEVRFLNDYGNSLIATEKKMKLPGNFWTGATGGPLMPKMNFMDGSDSDFGRDPMTGFMTALSNSPDAATEFFNTKDPQDNAQWVLKDRRSFDDGPPNSGPNAALDATGKAMFAATSGISDPEDPNAKFVQHTDEHLEALKRSVNLLAETGNDFPPEMRKSMAWALGNHGDTVHKAMSSPLDSHEFESGSLLEVSKQISRNQESYGLLNEQMNYAINAEINTEKENPEDSLRNAGSTIGFLEEARKLTINDGEDSDIRDISWKQRWLYHSVGGVITPFTDMGQRGIDAITAAWAQEQSDQVSDKATSSRQENYEARNDQLKAVADRWYAENSEWADNHEGFSKDQGIYREIRNAADHGNDKADGAGGVR